jgi:hypothetical protein
MALEESRQLWAWLTNFVEVDANSQLYGELALLSNSGGQ